MMQRLSALFFVVVLVPASVEAQRVEVSASAGYTLSEGIETEPVTAVGNIFEEVNPTSGGSWNLTFGVFATEMIEIEFLFARHESSLEAVGNIDKIELTDLTVDNYHGNVVYNFGLADARVRPFAFVGIGATRYDIGDIEGREVDGETKFSWTTGGGIKAYFTPVVGVKAMARWTPTYITTDAEGIWCDPIYCWVVGDAEYANQLEFSGGVTLRF